jgi:hypothetical protein
MSEPTIGDSWRDRALRAEADAVALREAADRFHHAVAMNKMFDGRFDLSTAERSKALMAALRADPPGHALLKELEAARAVVAVARQEKEIAKVIWTRPGSDTIALSDFEMALDRTIAAYDEFVRAFAVKGKHHV